MTRLTQREPVVEQDSGRRDRPLHLRAHAAMFLVWLVLFVAHRTAARWPESDWAVGLNAVSATLRRGLHAAVPLIPFSLHEAGIIVLIAAAIVLAARALFHAYFHGRRWRNIAAGGLLLSVSTFFVLDAWGALVQGTERRLVVDDLGWLDEDPPAPPTAEELLTWCRELIEVMNQEYIAAFGTDDLGMLTPPLPAAQLEPAIEAGYRHAAEVWNLPEPYTGRYSPLKPSLFPNLIWYLGGYVSPYTQEAVYNEGAPAFTQPFVAAHEKAHQRGIMAEDEANLLGYLACLHSDHPYVRYSGHLSILLKVSSRLDEINPEAVESLRPLVEEGPRRDLRFVPPARWFHDEWLVVFETTHEIILRYSGERRGVSVYNDIALLAMYARKTGGFLPHRPGTNPSGKATEDHA
jgi:hypothetical protein